MVGTAPASCCPAGMSLADYVDEIERGFINRALSKHGTVKGAAKELRVKAPTLYKKMQVLGVTPPRTRLSETRRHVRERRKAPKKSR